MFMRWIFETNKVNIKHCAYVTTFLRIYVGIYNRIHDLDDLLNQLALEITQSNSEPNVLIYNLQKLREGIEQLEEKIKQKDNKKLLRTLWEDLIMKILNFVTNDDDLTVRKKIIQLGYTEKVVCVEDLKEGQFNIFFTIPKAQTGETEIVFLEDIECLAECFSIASLSGGNLDELVKRLRKQQYLEVLQMNLVLLKAKIKKNVKLENYAVFKEKWGMLDSKISESVPSEFSLKIKQFENLEEIDEKNNQPAAAAAGGLSIC